ncbi:hypothetical protein D9613_007798 [Agrocybe pediades]|uniref:Calcineurin-like phosphoesterase domain-containing protein n=1 Tax=Agrocybe pediades TaxID=84607 RepID=A0A8H4QNP1_9AGAR|nr:hypothetical protein D9613_007798 [Agrocybe pediades]
MRNYLEKLLKKANYNPLQDVLIHVGDIISKGPHQGSLDTLDFMTAHNVTGVRGNHDQQVVEWRGWLGWISTMPRAAKWLQNLEQRWNEAQSDDDEDDTTLEFWLRKARSSASREEKSFWKLVPEDWLLFDAHYAIARDMTDMHYQYLLKLPLRLYIPSAHTFIVHAGLLPYNPHYPPEDASKQPLARIPTLRFTEPSQEDRIEKLRNLQEIAILKDIPQNTDPWVTLNMRSVAKGKVKKKAKEGKPWSKIWNQHMKNCVGYGRHGAKAERPWSMEDIEDDDNGVEFDFDNFEMSSTKKMRLLCYPSTTIYGHAAARGLEVKRWSFGLDTGCVYEKKLTALVIGGKALKHGAEIIGFEEYHEGADQFTMAKEKKHIPFGDNALARTVSVRCRN